ncbi:MAG: transporter substrate-binding domain-containing protein, partial [Anaerococcus sp.]|nr:transporter substrate-binding domain-containing protein [Anaerococcus sp.]
MKNRFKKLCAIIFTLCLLLPGKVQASSEKEDGKVLDFGTSADFPPYEYYEGDEIVGIDPDILRAIGDYMGVEVRLHDMDFNNIIASIDSGKIDGGAAGFTVTEERKKSVNFTDSFTKTSQIIITRKDSDIKEVEDLNNGVKIGTQLGTIGDTIAKDDFGEENVNSFNKVPDAILSLQNKKIDAVILDKHSAENFVNANKGLTIIETPYLEEEYAIAISKDNPELLEDMNEAIAALKESGEIDKIMDKYQKSDDKQASKGIFGRFKSNIIDNGAYKYLLDGLKTTLIVTICALIISFALGLLIALVRAANIDQAYENNGFGSVLINILD